MTQDELFSFCTRIWDAREEALLRVLEDIPDRDTWEGVRAMLARTDRRLAMRLVAFGVAHPGQDDEAFPGQAFLAKHRRRRETDGK